MKEGSRFLRWGVKAFKILAWIILVVQTVLGIVLLVMGGAPVPIGNGEIPARLVGVLNCVGAVIYFFMMYLIASVLRVLLDLHEQVSRPGTS